MSRKPSILGDIASTIRWRRRLMPIARAADAQAPRSGEVAPDFTLCDSKGENPVTLSDFRGKRPVVLFFGSYT